MSQVVHSINKSLIMNQAGTVSIYSHMMANGGRDDRLFRAGILQSGGAFPLEHPNATAFQETFDSLIKNTFCSSFTNASAEKQLEGIRQLPIQPFLSSFALPAGKYDKVATIVETDGCFRPITLPNSTVSKLLSFYPNDPRQGCPYNTGTVPLTGGTLDKKACSIFSDAVQIGPARLLAKWLTKHNNNNNHGHSSSNNRRSKALLYRYRFNHLLHDVDDSNITRGITTGIEQRGVPESALPFWHEYGSEGKNMVFSGYGSGIEEDNYRAEGVEFGMEKVMSYGAL
ncbi:hypothetical protein BJY00DRAFT_310799 [Aspergillus carlsbadensis]|nr:hypothetical protein BJY00DRAFT_310799 [Aspergillus carlsbadensis]